MTTKLDHPVGTIAANAATPVEMYPLRPGLNRVDVTYPSGTTATITPKSTKDPNNTDNLASVEIDGAALEITGTEQFQVVGPGWLCFVVASFSGTDPIDVFISR